MVLTGTANEAAQRLLKALEDFGPVLTIKLYRLGRGPGPDVPYIPCLDHEAMLHEHVDRHGALYVQEAASGDIHEIVFIPDARRLQIDTASTLGEHSLESRERLRRRLKDKMPDFRVEILRPSWWRGERRVAATCLAQVSLRDVLTGNDPTAVRAGIERLQAVAGLMEKQSRVGSWGVRTVTGPLLAAAGVVSYLVLDQFSDSLGEMIVTALQYAIVGTLGAAFVYYGLKAVQLTEMSNRVWKRTAEYNLILSERKRLGR